MAKAWFLERRVCNYNEYTNRLADAVASWQEETGRKEIRNRKDWEFVASVDFWIRYGKASEFVLDAACGQEPLVDWLANKFKTVVASDLWQPDYLEWAGIRYEDFLRRWRNLPNVYPMFADVLRLPVNDGVSDATFCISSIEHVGPEDGSHDGAEQALNELIRVTKSGGLIVWSTEVKPDAEKDSWYFTPSGLDEFSSRFDDDIGLVKGSYCDGSDELAGVYPVICAMRKL